MLKGLKKFAAQHPDWWVEAMIAALVIGGATYYNGAVGIIYGVGAILFWSIPRLLICATLLVRSGIRSSRRRRQPHWV